MIVYHHLCVIVFILQSILLIMPADPVEAEDKNGVSPNTVSLPTGPGSVEGLGDAFQPMLNTGTARYTVKIGLPPGVAGNTPSLNLQYDSGLGHGFSGLGWIFGPGSISRQVDKGLPLYVDNDNNLDDDNDGLVDEPDEKDTFIGPDGEELVEVADNIFRARVEGTFARYRQVNAHWEVDLKNGTKLTFGETTGGRVTDKPGSHIFKWLLEKSTDVHGNIIAYTYASFPGSDNQKYLKEIRYGPGPPPWDSFYFVSFSYEARQDWRKDYRSGFRIKTAHRLTAINVGIQGVQPDQCAVGDFNYDTVTDALISRYTLSYDSTTHISHLAQIVRFGADGVNYLPPVSFTYSTHTPLFQINADDTVITSTNPPHSVMDSGLSEFIDLNRDGLPDILTTDMYGNAHTCYLNEGEAVTNSTRTIQWADGKQLQSDDSQALALHLVEDVVNLADMNGDGISDLVHTPLTNEVFYYTNRGDLSWGPRQRMSVWDIAPPAPYSSKKISTVDLDFNKRMDVLQSTSTGYSIWFNYEDGKYSSELHTTGATLAGRVMLFDDEGVQLADMNGDRLNDVAMVTANRIIYAASMGYGNFDSAVAIPIPGTALTDGENGQISRAKLTDINGDGLADLVVERAGVNELWFWINQGIDAFSEKYTVTGMPGQFGPDTELRWADLNGNGTTDLVYADTTAVDRLRIIDIGLLAAGSPHPNLLTRIDNGLGVITNINYLTSTDHYLAAQAAGEPWTTTVPFPTPVVSEVLISPGFDGDGDGETIDDEYLRTFTYRDGYYEDREKQFRGFAKVTVTEYGDETAPTTVMVNDFFTGGPDGLDNDGDTAIDEVSHDHHREEDALKGKLKTVQLETGDGEIFSRTESSWLVKNIAFGMNNVEIRFAYDTQTEKIIYEGETTPETIKTEFYYDDYGNLINERKFGALSITGDELFSTYEYINDSTNWLLGLPLRSTVTDGLEVKAAETVNYYDGADYIGLPLGQVDKGNLTRRQDWVTGSTYIDRTRLAYDSYGNILTSLNPNGFLRSIIWDPDLQTYPVLESIEIGGTPDLSVSAAYNLGFGVVTSTRDFNNNQTTYGYDIFGRLTSTVQPGDSIALPTREFEYNMANPAVGLMYQYDAGGVLTLTVEQAIASSVMTRSREISGQPTTLDTIQFVDGLGRSLAVVREDEQGFVVSGSTLFNGKGTVRYQFLPYHTESSEYTPPAPGNYAAENMYDAVGRIVQTINPPDKNGVITSSSNSFLPLSSTTVDENNHTKTVFSDGLGKKITIHEQNLGETYITQYRYDVLGNLVNITDAQQNTKTILYDGLSRKTSMDDPDAGHRDYIYDDADNLIRSTDNMGQVVTCTYDGANRRLTEEYEDAAGINPDALYYYDSPASDYPDAENLKGKLAWVKDLSGSSYFSYDNRGNLQRNVKRIIEGTHVSDFISHYTYDSLNRADEVQYPDGDRLTYSYGNHGFLQSIDGFVDHIRYHPSGQIASFDFANGITTTYGYDPRQLLKSLQSINASLPADPIQDLSYDLDGVGNMTGISDLRSIDPNIPANGTQLLQYDDLDRLTRAEGTGYGAIDFQYDKIGNLVSKKSPDMPDPQHIADPLINLGTIESGGTAGTSSRSLRLPGDEPGPHALTATASGLLYTYDDNGNITGNANGDVYQWDFRDRLIKTSVGSTVTEYIYDYAGQRVIKKNINESTAPTALYVNSEYEVRDGKVVKYIFANSRRVAQVEGRLTPVGEQTEQVLYFHTGWNFFSLDVEPVDPAIASVLNSLSGNYSEIWTFDAATQQYVGHVPGEGLDDLTEIHSGKGYLIKISTPTLLVVSGPHSINDTALLDGWNFIACPTDSPLPISEALSTIDGLYESVWEYTVATGWQVFLSQSAPDFLSNLEMMIPGRAYWVKMNHSAVLPFQQIPPTVRFFHPDHLGSSSLVTDSDGTIVERTEFYPFGRPRYEENSGFDSDYTYTDQELDTESGLMYFGARYYDPVIGRFVSVDPYYRETNALETDTMEKFLLNPQQINLYSYVHNNPLNWTDPSGLEVEIRSGTPTKQGGWEAGKGSFDVAETIALLVIAKNRTVQGTEELTRGAQVLRELEKHDKTTVIVAGKNNFNDALAIKKEQLEEILKDPARAYGLNESEVEGPIAKSKIKGGSEATLIRFDPSKKGDLPGGVERDPESTLVHEGQHAFDNLKGVAGFWTKNEKSAGSTENQHRAAKGLKQRIGYVYDKASNEYHVLLEQFKASGESKGKPADED